MGLRADGHHRRRASDVEGNFLGCVVADRPTCDTTTAVDAHTGRAGGLARQATYNIGLYLCPPIESKRARGTSFLSRVGRSRTPQLNKKYSLVGGAKA